MKLGEIGIRNHGTKITAGEMQKLHKVGGEVRVFAGGATVADVAYEDVPEKDIVTRPSIIVKSRGYIGFEYYEKPFTHKNELWSYTIQDANFNSKFVYYYLLTVVDKLQFIAKANSVKIPQLSTKITDELAIPVPPLAVQEEIVAILDRFETLVNDLSVGLPAELAARRRQYEYYRDRLLTFQPLEQKP